MDVTTYAEGIHAAFNFDWLQNLRFGRVIRENFQKKVKKKNLNFSEGHNFWCKKNLNANTKNLGSQKPLIWTEPKISDLAG